TLHHLLLNTVLPELGQYLRDDTIEVLADNLQTTPQTLSGAIIASKLPHGPSMPEFRGWFRGDKPLRSEEQEKHHIFLKVQNANPVLRPLINRQVFNSELYVALFGRRVVTLTGRARGGMLFAEARQAEYLDLADDAVKAALFALAADRLNVVAFADNEV